MQLTEHFSLSELTTTSTGFDNTPNAEQTTLLKTLAIFLEKVRAILGNAPIFIDSAFRSAAVNEAVGGVSDSAHALAFAADIRHATMTPWEVAKALSKAQEDGKIDFDQLIYEQEWVHVSRDPQLRGQRLTHVPADGSYLDGLVGP
jgi:zinc D-Ala-D-Ala carboxypeptidase